ncbi:MAG: S9 family peptidase [Chloroflexota bacterium]
MTHSISRYLSVQAAYAPDFSGDGRAISFISDISGVPQVWQVAAARGERPWWPRQLTFAPDRVLGLWQAPGDGRLVFARDAGGNENAQLFLLDGESGERRALTAGHEEAMHLFGCWAHDGSAFYFAANRRHPGRFDLYAYDLEAGAAQLLWEHEEPGYLANFSATRDGARLAFSRVQSSFKHDLFEFNLRRGEARQLSPAGERATYEQVAYSPGGLTLYVVTDLESDFLHIRRLEPASGTWETLVSPNWDVELMALSPSGRYLAYAVNVEGGSRLEMIDMARGAGWPGPELGATPGVVGYFDQRLAFSPDDERLAFSFSSATRTSDVYVWELQEDGVYPATMSAHGGLPVDSFVAPELVHYPTFDEREIPAWYYRPSGAGGDGAGFPVVVIVHGGPESQYRPAFSFLAQYLVHHGYGVLAPNVRGSTGYGNSYSHLDNAEKRMDAVADLAHAARWLKGREEVDGERIAVYGGSYGGFMVLSALATYPELWAAGVDIVGISDFVTFLENTSDYRRAHREAEYGSLAEHREFLESIAPMRHVERIRAPLMVIHGANDPRVPLSEAQQLVEALRERDVPVEFLVFDDEGHGIVKLQNKRVAYPAIVAFLDQQLSIA